MKLQFDVDARKGITTQAGSFLQTDYTVFVCDGLENELSLSGDRADMLQLIMRLVERMDGDRFGPLTPADLGLDAAKWVEAQP